MTIEERRGLSISYLLESYLKVIRNVPKVSVSLLSLVLVE
jgi:hypothetical protein